MNNTEDKQGESESRLDFTTLPTSQLDTYISYYELAPSFPPPLDPLPATIDAGNATDEEEEEDRGEGSDGSDSEAYLYASASAAAALQRKRKRSGSLSSRAAAAVAGAGKTRAERDKLKRQRREKEAAYEEEQAAKQREREARERENMGLPPEQPLGRRAAAAVASSKMRNDIMDPFGDVSGPGGSGRRHHDGTGAADDGTGYGGAGNGSTIGPGAAGSSAVPSAGSGAQGGPGGMPLPGDDPPCPEFFFDGEAANNHLSAVASKHFSNLPQPKEGEIVVGFLYKCRTRDKILKIA